MTRALPPLAIVAVVASCATTTTTTATPPSPYDAGRREYLAAARSTSPPRDRATAFEAAASVASSKYAALSLMNAAEAWADAGDAARANAAYRSVRESTSSLRVAAAVAAGERVDDAGELHVHTELPAAVFLDEEAVGTSPLAAMPLPPGVYALRISREAFDDVDTQVKVERGKRTDVDVTLTAQPPAPPEERCDARSPWVIGAAVVGLVGLFACEGIASWGLTGL